MQKLSRIVLRLIFPPFIYMTIQIVCSTAIMYGYAFYLGGGERGLYQSAQFISQHALLLTAFAALLALPLLFWLFSRDVENRPSGSRPPQGLAITLLWAALLGLGLCLTLNIALNLSGLSQYFTGFEEVSARLYMPPFWQQLLATVLIIPLGEEMVFRALMFRGLRADLPFWAAALLSSLAFAIYHGNVYQGVYAFCLGFFMAWVYERCQALLAPVLLHLSANLLSILLSLDSVQPWMNAHPSWYLLFVMVMLAATVVSYVMVRKHTA